MNNNNRTKISTGPFEIVAHDNDQVIIEIGSLRVVVNDDESVAILRDERWEQTSCPK